MRAFAAILLGLMLAGCAVVHDGPRTARFKAVGYGAVPDNLRQSPAQRRLLGIRAAKLDAYRNLAEQVYGMRVTGQGTVQEMMLRSDSFRTYVDAYLGGSRLVSIQPVDETTYEVTVELDLNGGFYSCVEHTYSCAPPPVPQRSCDGCLSDCRAPCGNTWGGPDVRYLP